MKIRYEGRWKEELHGFAGDLHFIVELAMGRLHTYFPTEENWQSCAPAEAKNLWKNARDAAENWSQENDAAFDVDQGAWVEFVTSNANE